MDNPSENITISKASPVLPSRLTSVGVERVGDIVWVADDVLSEKDCLNIINSSKDSLSRSTVLNGESEEDSRLNEGRTSTNAWLLAKDLDVESEAFNTLHKIEKITESFTEQPIINQEGLQVLRYQEGQEYQPHHDFFHENHKEYDKCMAQGGQRLFTVYFYLNNVEEGGETFFPRLDIKVSPKMGRAVIWQNIVEGEPFHPSLHWGMPPTKGEKWGCTKWIREREFIGDTKADYILRNQKGKAACETQRDVKITKKSNKLIDTSKAEIIIV